MNRLEKTRAKVWPSKRLFLLAAGLFLWVTAAVGQPPAKHPSELKFDELLFEVPRAEQLRHMLTNKTAVYVVEDHTLPLFSVTAIVRAGSFLEPADKVGLAALTGRLLNRGGAGDLAAAEFDERAEFLAAELSASVGDTSGQARVDCLSTVMSDCLDLFFLMLESPRFEEARLEVEKKNLLEDLKQRNDDPQQIGSREWKWLLYGTEHFSSREVTGASLKAIEAKDLRAFHRDYFSPRNLIWAVAGDVDSKKIVAELNKRIGSWPASGKDVPWPPPKAHNQPQPGLYVVEKDIPQGRAIIGHLAPQRDGWKDPREMAALVMNDILGGGGFTSRITKRIRSDEGLAYSAGSGLNLGTFWSGRFGVFYQSKSETVAFAAKIALEEIRRIRNEPVSDEELSTSKASFIETFPGNFESARVVANLFATDEYLGRPHSYWYDYRDRVKAIDKPAVQLVAKEILDPARALILVVGDWKTIEKGDADHRASMLELFPKGPTMLPLRDPVTLEAVDLP